ncbi:MAG: endonuclease [Bacteroidales bacterium]|nr:endonuclease [Bacteroidales bacterium]MBN2748325.1 endonuclease [Bacteroidales bacterium]
MIKRFISLFALAFTLLPVLAQIPAGYYNTAKGKTGAELKTALYVIIKDHDALSYAGLWTAFQTTDRKSNGNVWDMYSDNPGGTPPYEYTFIADQCGNYSGENSCYNREHSFPKSWFNDGYPMYTDLFHLYPTDGYVNGKRSNYPFGEVGSASWTSMNGSKLGTSSFPGYSGTVFEPIDEYKGDFARTYFYMVTRYENVVTSWNSDVLDGSKYPAFTTWTKNMLLEWHRQDPVSPKEVNRNNTIYNDFQHNRNPFIDYPDYAECIWATCPNGDPTGIDVVTERLDASLYPNPASDMVTVVTPDNLTVSQLELFNLIGQRIYSDNVEGKQSPFTLQLSGVKPGVYLVRVVTHKGTVSKRLVVK